METEIRQFQFHKGTIKTGQKVITTADNKDFNSIKVRLKLGGVCSSVCVPPFQFHKGTIKTVGGIFSKFKNTLFQFHKGTIKTLINTI